ncbi:MAG TPA: SRPBCC family protein [Planctomycetota bacterium]
MKKLFNWLIVLASIVGAFYGVGLIVPRSQTLGAKTTFTTVPRDVYAIVADVSAWPQWHPNVVMVKERGERNSNPLWQITAKDGRSFELEVMGQEDEKTWNGTYTSEGTRTNLRFDLSWYGSGTRLRVTRSADTRDPWQRARDFFTPSKDVPPIALLNAIATHFGEAGQAESN